MFFFFLLILFLPTGSLAAKCVILFSETGAGWRRKRSTGRREALCFAFQNTRRSELEGSSHRWDTARAFKNDSEVLRSNRVSSSQAWPLNRRCSKSAFSAWRFKTRSVYSFFFCEPKKKKNEKHTHRGDKKRQIVVVHQCIPTAHTVCKLDFSLCLHPDVGRFAYLFTSICVSACECALTE